MAYKRARLSFSLEYAWLPPENKGTPTGIIGRQAPLLANTAVLAEARVFMTCTTQDVVRIWLAAAPVGELGVPVSEHAPAPPHSRLYGDELDEVVCWRSRDERDDSDSLLLLRLLLVRLPPSSRSRSRSDSTAAATDGRRPLQAPRTHKRA